MGGWVWWVVGREEGGGRGELSPLFMLSVGHIDSLHQSPASQQASGGGRGELTGGEGLTLGLQERVGDGERGGEVKG